MKKFITCLTLILVFSTVMSVNVFATGNLSPDVSPLATSDPSDTVALTITNSNPEEEVDPEDIVWTKLGEIEVPAENSRGYARITIDGSAIRSGYRPELQIYIRWSGPYGVSLLKWDNLVVRTDGFFPSMIYAQFPLDTAYCNGEAAGMWFVGYTQQAVPLDEKTVSMKLSNLYATVFVPGDTIVLSVSTPGQSVVIN